MSTPLVISLADVDPSLISVMPPKRSMVSSSAEATITYKGKPFIIQVGTPTDPALSPWGLERYVGGTGKKKYETIDSNDPTWTFSEKTSIFNKVCTAKLDGKIKLKNYETPGTTDYTAYTKMKAIMERIVDCFSNGVAQTEGGQPVKLWDVSLPREVVARMISTPLREQNGEYAPELKFKTRYRVVNKENETLNVNDDNSLAYKLNMDSILYDGNQATTTTPVADPFEHLSRGGSGIWLFQFSPAQITKAAVHVVMELVKAKVCPNRSSRDVSFAIDGQVVSGGGNGAAFGSSTGAGSAATSFSGSCAAEVEEPASKRLKLDVNAV